MKKDNKCRLYLLLAGLLANVACTVLVAVLHIETTAMKVIGSYAAVILAALAAWRFPISFYLSVIGFVFFASSLGSCVNLYRHVGFYDLFVHYLSGIVLAQGGEWIGAALLYKRGLAEDRLVKSLFAFFFSCAGAGFWEIYEFTADLLLNAQMQGSKGNTMGDIIAGTLGALTWLLVFTLLSRRKKDKNASSHKTM